MRRSVWLVLVTLTVAGPVSAQQLRDRVNQLFIFGTGDDPLFLAGSADPGNPASVQAHGSHYIPAAVDGNATLISFLTSAIGANVASLPIGATSSGQTFQFVGGVPVATSTSHGPVFAERAQTLGLGRVLVAATVNFFHFAHVRGVDLDNIQLTFTHQNVDFEGCDETFGGDCSLYGIPTLENDFIQMRLRLDLDVRSTVFLLTYGLRDWMDVGVALPIVSTSLRGTSEAQVVPFGGPTAAHFFSGTPSSPGLSASRFVEGSATGLGDVSARMKVRVVQGEQTAFAVLVDGRFATGAEEDFLGSGHTSIRGLGIVSSRFGAFSPHANVGYVHRFGGLQADAMLATVGFDQAMAPWATLAVDIIAELQAGTSELTIPEPVRLDVPFDRTITPTNIPDRRDDIVNASVGFKFQAAEGLMLVANALWPLNRGGLRPDAAWSTGLEYNF